MIGRQQISHEAKFQNLVWKRLPVLSKKKLANLLSPPTDQTKMSHRRKKNAIFSFFSDSRFCIYHMRYTLKTIDTKELYQWEKAISNTTKINKRNPNKKREFGLFFTPRPPWARPRRCVVIFASPFPGGRCDDKGTKQKQKQKHPKRMKRDSPPSNWGHPSSPCRPFSFSSLDRGNDTPMRRKWWMRWQQGLAAWRKEEEEENKKGPKRER